MVKGRSAIKPVFVDSSVLFAAVYSPTGGSAKLFTLKSTTLVTSKVVLIEVERNVRKKLRTYHLKRFFLLTSKLTILAQIPNDKLIKKARSVIVEKDAVILAEAKSANTKHLVTLDQKHFFTPKVAMFLKPKKVMTPKMLLDAED